MNNLTTLIEGTGQERLMSDTTSSEAQTGTVYIVGNEGFSELKIGFTTSSLESRMAGWQTTSPTKFRPHCTFAVRNPHKIEQVAHRILAEARVGKQEFFACSVAEAMMAVRQASKKMNGNVPAANIYSDEATECDVFSRPEYQAVVAECEKRIRKIEEQCENTVKNAHYRNKQEMGGLRTDQEKVLAEVRRHHKEDIERINISHEGEYRSLQVEHREIVIEWNDSVESLKAKAALIQYNKLHRKIGRGGKALNKGYNDGDWRYAVGVWVCISIIVVTLSAMGILK